MDFTCIGVFRVRESGVWILKNCSRPGVELFIFDLEDESDEPVWLCREHLAECVAENLGTLYPLEIPPPPPTFS